MHHGYCLEDDAMTWNRSDAGHKPLPDPLKGRRHVLGSQTPVPPEQAINDDPECLPSVFEAMGIKEGENFFGESQRFPPEFERELMTQGWYPERSWVMVRRMMLRDIEAV